MDEAYGIFVVAAATFAVLAWLEWRKPDPGGIMVIALLGALFMAVFAWVDYTGG